MKTSKLLQRITMGLLAALVLVFPVANALAVNATITTSSTVLKNLTVTQTQQLRWGSIVQPSATTGCTAYDVIFGTTSTIACAVASTPQDGTFLGTGAQTGTLSFEGEANTDINVVFDAADCTPGLTGVTLTRLSPGKVAGRSIVLNLNSAGIFNWVISGTIEVLGSSATGAFDCTQTVTANY